LATFSVLNPRITSFFILFLLTQEEQSGRHQDDEKEGCTFDVGRGMTSGVLYVRNLALYGAYSGRVSFFV